MILRFGVSNYRSIRDYQELSLIASSLKDVAGEPLSLPDQQLEVLPIVAIYGANASGKSNILRAINFMTAGTGRSHQSKSEGMS